MAIQTVCDIFYRSVDTYRKPEHLKYKKDGAWRAISSEELRARGRGDLDGPARPRRRARATRSPSSPRTGPSGPSPTSPRCARGRRTRTIYATLTAPQVQYILADSEAKVVFVSNAAQAAKVAEVRAQLPHLQHVVRFDDGARRRGRRSLDELRAKGREALAQPTPTRCAGAPPR